jgi:hypothetical protein
MYIKFYIIIPYLVPKRTDQKVIYAKRPPQLRDGLFYKIILFILFFLGLYLLLLTHIIV